VMKDINSTGFGLTSGLHSRIDETVEQWLATIEAGNLYVNRNTVGAVVGVQPFGGMGLSGTGPKAGGPLYLQRLVNRKEWDLQDIEGGEKVDLSSLVAGLKATLSGAELDNAMTLMNQLSDQSPLGKVLTMQGITGEDNFMCLVSRPIIAISNGSLDAQIKALIAIAVAGSKAVVLNGSPLFQHASHFGNLISVVDDFNTLSELSVLVVLDPLSVEQKLHFAQREGAILTYVESLDLALSLFPLLHEKAVSINTAAAGGNASLMSEMD
ncbi:aldehyde dehydrogenase family protein, partial [Otariodibacter sp.]|uniref:aldehyde dehydrogenase family protein n=1 Tax=Otariodibacter sp. TaxID=3030919 RepID=UPI0026345A69